MESILIICDASPFGTNIASEAIRMGAGFMGLGNTVRCKILFRGEGVLSLKKNLNPSIIGLDPIDEGLEMASLTELPLIAVQEDLDQYNLRKLDLIAYDQLSILRTEEIPRLFEEFPCIFHI